MKNEGSFDTTLGKSGGKEMGNMENPEVSA